MNVIRSTAAVTDAAAAVADRRDTGDLVAELHDHAAMNE
jgi:hypothetical protein